MATATANSGLGARVRGSKNASATTNVYDGLNVTEAAARGLSPVASSTSATTTTTTDALSNIHLVPLQVQAVDISKDGDFPGGQLLSSPSAESQAPGAGGSVRRIGLLRDKDEAEGREEMELQMSTTDALAVAVATTTTECPMTTRETNMVKEGVASEPDSKVLSVIPTASPANEKEDDAPPNHSVSVAAAIALTSAAPALDVEGKEVQTEVMTAAAGEAAVSLAITTARPEASWSPTPVYVAGGEQHQAFLYMDDFARYLNRHYYSRPVFDSVAWGRAAS